MTYEAPEPTSVVVQNSGVVEAVVGMFTTLWSKWLDLGNFAKLVAMPLMVIGLASCGGALVLVYSGFERRAMLFDAAFAQIRRPVLDHLMAAREVEAFHRSITVPGAEASFVVFINTRTARRGVVAWAADPTSRAMASAVAADEVDVPLDQPGIYTTVEMRVHQQRPYWVATNRDRWDRLIVPIPPSITPDSDIVGMLVVLVEKSASAASRTSIEDAAVKWALALAGRR